MPQDEDQFVELGGILVLEPSEFREHLNLSASDEFLPSPGLFGAQHLVNYV